MEDFKLLQILENNLLDGDGDLLSIAHDENIFCECIKRNFIRSFRWLKETRKTRFKYSIDKILECALEYGREEFVDIIGLEHINMDMIFKISNMNLFLKAFEVLSNRPFCKVVKEKIFENAAINYAKNEEFGDILLYSFDNFILDENGLISHSCLNFPIYWAAKHILCKKSESSNLILKRLLNYLGKFTKKNKIDLFKQCCKFENLEFAKYIYEFCQNNENNEKISIDDIDVIDDVIDDVKIIKSCEMLQWLYSIVDDKEKFKNNITIENLETYEFALSLGIVLDCLDGLFDKACKNGNLEFAKFLKREFSECTVTEETIIENIKNNRIEMIEWFYENQFIRNVKIFSEISTSEMLELILSFSEEFDDEIQILETAIKIKNRKILMKYLNRIDINDKTLNDLISSCIFYGFFDGFRLLVKDRDFDKQGIFTMSVCYPKPIFAKYIFNMGGVKITEEEYQYNGCSGDFLGWILQNMSEELKVQLRPQIREHFSEMCEDGNLNLMIELKDFGNITDQDANEQIRYSNSYKVIKFLREFYDITDESLIMCAKYNEHCEISFFLFAEFGPEIYFRAGLHDDPNNFRWFKNELFDILEKFA